MSEPTAHPVRTGGRILVDALRVNGADTVYCVPGESYLPVLDALHDVPSIQLVVTRHEGAAANMADAYGKFRGRPGICFVTRGPGATHASIGVHTASQDSTPMILFIGQVDAAFEGREGFQEVDYGQMFGGMAKWVTQINDPARIPEIVSRAYSVATSGRPGPVVIALPENVLFGSGACADALPAVTAQASPAASDMATLHAALLAAQRPLVIIGGSGWDDEACTALHTFAQAYDLPVAASFRRQDVLDNRADPYVGQVGLAVSPSLARRVQDADLVVAIGTRLSEATSGGYTLFESPTPRQALVHVHADANELGRVFHPTLAINAGVRTFALAASELPGLGGIAAPWAAWRQAARADYIAHSSAPVASPTMDSRGHVDMTDVVRHLDTVLPDDAFIANGAGNYTVWVHRFYRYRRLGTELAPTSGAMGYGLPAAIAAKLAHPDRVSVCFAGDGCFMMYPQELATALQYGAAVIVLVVNNGMLGTIRMHQEREYPSRVSGTALRNPDFVALAQSFGAYAERVDRTSDFAAAFERARASGGPALLDLRTDARQITPAARLAA